VSKLLKPTALFLFVPATYVNFEWRNMEVRYFFKF